MISEHVLKCYARTNKNKTEVTSTEGIIFFWNFGDTKTLVNDDLKILSKISIDHSLINLAKSHLMLLVSQIEGCKLICEDLAKNLGILIDKELRLNENLNRLFPKTN